MSEKIQNATTFGVIPPDRAFEFAKTPPPRDCHAPEWDVYHKTHNWRNHIGEEVRLLWGTFTPEQQIALAREASERASAEEWE